jgi:ABC-type nickel/cobalt efflux system permease component RcnA
MKKLSIITALFMLLTAFMLPGVPSFAQSNNAPQKQEQQKHPEKKEKNEKKEKKHHKHHHHHHNKMKADSKNKKG